MKKFLKILGIIILTILAVLYLAFLFVLPKTVDLNQYKPMLQQIVKEQGHLDIDFGDIKLITTPLLGAGIKTDKITVKYEDGVELLTADSLKARVSLPSLLLYTVKISCLDIENPKVNLDIVDGKNMQILQHIDKILTEQEKDIEAEKNVNTEPSLIDTSKIRIKVPNVRFINYLVKANDIKNKHNLTLKGDKLRFGYFNGKTIKIKTNASILSDDNTNIVANIDINTFLPAPTKLDEEDDKRQRAELPYANIVEIYRTYDLKTNIDAKLKIRQKEDKTKLWGYANIDDLTLKLSSYTLPKSYAHVKFKGEKAIIDTDLSVKENQNIKMIGFVKYDKHPALELNINTDKIYFQSFVDFARGVLDTFQIKNNLAQISVKGFIEAKTKINSNFKKLKSDGKIIVRDGSFVNKKTGLNISKTNADVIFDNNTLHIKDTKLFIDNVPLYMEGSINEKSVADIKIKTDNLPLKGIYNTFAPYEVKNSYIFNSGDLSLDVKLAGELKKAVLDAKASLNNLLLSDKMKSMFVANEQAKISAILAQKDIKIKLTNKNLSVSLPKTKSFIKNENTELNIENDEINLLPSKLLLNKNSQIIYQAKIIDWQKSKKTFIDFIATGKLNTQDLKQFAGKELAQFLDAKGTLPLKVSFNGNTKRQELFAQISTDAARYITPINIEAIKGVSNVLQLKIAFKGNHLKIKETGLFNESFVTDSKTGEEKIDLKEIIGIDGTIVNLKSEPFINLLKINVPKNLNITVNGFKKADFIFGGNLFVFGKTSSPRYKGKFFIDNLNIQDLLLSMKKMDMNFSDRKLNVNVDNLLLNGSDVELQTKMDLEPSPIFAINELNVSSKNIDVDKMLLVFENLNKFLPQSKSSKTNSSQNDIPVIIEKGNLSVENLKTGEIKVKNILGDISLFKNTFYLNRLTAKAFDGNIFGNIAMNLLNGILHIQMGGNELNTNKTLIDTANLKNILFGKLSFNTDLSMNVLASGFEEQLKSIDGTVDFTIENGQLGPFGRLENMILAENIRESAFFQTALGGIVSNLTTIDTTHFEIMKGNLVLKDAIVEITPITSKGSVLNLYLIGNMDILKNMLDMKVRVKLGSEISNMLGPIAALNPINLIKSTPGLNVAMAKAFALFCEEVSADEMEIIPKFDSKSAENFATKFQIVLRGDVAKPLSLIKSFKWLATSTEMAEAESFVDSLPEPVVTEDGRVLQTAEEINAYNAYNAKRTTKIKKAVKKFFTKEKK